LRACKAPRRIRCLGNYILGRIICYTV
jgi:hypothetical protein